MHPDIKKFWADKYTHIYCLESQGIRTYYHQEDDQFRPPQRQNTVCIEYVKEGIIKYFYNHKVYNESEMLRIIKINCFA